MMRSWTLAVATMLVLPVVGALPASAVTTTVTGLGLDFGGACLSTAASCSAEFNFDVTPIEPVTGTFDYTPGSPGSMDIDLEVADFSLTGSGPDGVEEIVFTSLQISIFNWATLEVGTEIQGLGFGNATITGSYTQLDAFGGTVQLPVALNEVILASGLTCSLALPGQCGLLLTARDLKITVGDGGTSLEHDVQFGINVAVPEPSTALLLGVGLCLLPALRRAR